MKNEIYTTWKCAVMINGKRKYKEFALIGNVEDAYKHVVQTYGILNFRMVKPLCG